MDQNLSLVERAEISRLRIAEPDHSDKLVVDWIGDGNRVRKLLGGIDSITMADWNVRRFCGGGSLAGTGRMKAGERSAYQNSDCGGELHYSLLLHVH
jgi:hypothetical protein